MYVLYFVWVKSCEQRLRTSLSFIIFFFFSSSFFALLFRIYSRVYDIKNITTAAAAFIVVVLNFFFSSSFLSLLRGRVVVLDLLFL